MELSLVGLQGAGKSSLVNVLTHGAFQEDTIPTVRNVDSSDRAHALRSHLTSGWR